jgi:hypothetical protein
MKQQSVVGAEGSVPAILFCETQMAEVSFPAKGCDTRSEECACMLSCWRINEWSPHLSLIIIIIIIIYFRIHFIQIQVANLQAIGYKLSCMSNVWSDYWNSQSIRKKYNGISNPSQHLDIDCLINIGPIGCRMSAKEINVVLVLDFDTHSFFGLRIHHKLFLTSI